MPRRAARRAAVHVAQGRGRAQRHLRPARAARRRQGADHRRVHRAVRFRRRHARARIGPKGEVRVIDITDEARDNYIAKKRGRGGQLATWQWTYIREFADGAFDCAACLQGVQHTDDWRETGAEMLRVMKPGRNLVLAEIAYSPETAMKIGLDMHIEYVFDKLLARVGWKLDEFPYYSPKDLERAFAGLVKYPGSFVWKGIEIFWGRKP